MVLAQTASSLPIQESTCNEVYSVVPCYKRNHKVGLIIATSLFLIDFLIPHDPETHHLHFSSMRSTLYFNMQYLFFYYSNKIDNILIFLRPKNCIDQIKCSFYIAIVHSYMVNYFVLFYILTLVRNTKVNIII